MTSKRATQSGGRIVRPYTMTGGRTGAGRPLIALEALVAVTPAGMRMRTRFRARAWTPLRRAASSGCRGFPTTFRWGVAN